MKGYIIREQIGQAMTASAKAHEDVEYFLRQRGYQQLTVHLYDLSAQRLVDKIRRHRQYRRDWQTILRTVEPGSLVVIQYPLKLNAIGREGFIQRLRQRKGVKTAVLIHDLDQLRGLATSDKIPEVVALNRLGDFIICHNASMKRYLTEQGLPPHKIYTLELFDYRAQPTRPLYSHPLPQVVVAGNLDPRKSGYVYELHQIPSVQFELYGVLYSESDTRDNLHYHGAFPPEQLPTALQGTFGLVWDGNTIDTCGGKTGEYLRYNNPHKLSLYMAAGIPAPAGSATPT